MLDTQREPAADRNSFAFSVAETDLL